MNPIRNITLATLFVAAIFLPLDAAWLSWQGPRLYQSALGPLLAPRPDWLAVALFYPIYLMGIVVFLVLPAQQHGARGLALRAILFGLVTYGTYDLTNQATLQGWPWWLTGIDLTWGIFVTTVAATGGHALLNRFSRH